MTALPFVEILLLLAAAIFAARRARGATPPFGRPMAWIGFLLALELGVLVGFVALQMRWRWGAGGAVHPAGMAFATQALRALLLLAAASAWLGLVRGELRRGAPAPPRLADAARWMGDDGAAADVTVRAGGRADGAVPGDSAFTGGLLVEDESLFLAARRRVGDRGSRRVPGA